MRNASMLRQSEGICTDCGALSMEVDEPCQVCGSHNVRMHEVDLLSPPTIPPLIRALWWAVLAGWVIGFLSICAGILADSTWWRLW